VAGMIASVDGDGSGHEATAVCALMNRPMPKARITSGVLPVSTNAAIDRAVDDHLAIAEPMGDLHASGEYRGHLAGAYGKRALRLARDRAGG
ncbi:MAG: hypothetical protein ACE5EG_10765, partial [Thermoanaerobaculia bacterium]